jgi:hypothetical protein
VSTSHTQLVQLDQSLGASRENANWERREKLGRLVAPIVSLEDSIAVIAFELPHFPFATEPSERGGRQERRRGLLKEAGRTGGRSKAKDCAREVFVGLGLFGALAQLRPAAAGLGGSDRPLRERCS